MADVVLGLGHPRSSRERWDHRAHKNPNTGALAPRRQAWLNQPNTTQPSHRSSVWELLEASALQAMLDDGSAEACRIVGRQLPTFFLEEKWLWQIRLDQLHRSPDVAPWLVRAVVLHPQGTVVGHAGFHGPPDQAASCTSRNAGSGPSCATPRPLRATGTCDRRRRRCASSTGRCAARSTTGLRRRGPGRPLPSPACRTRGRRCRHPRRRACRNPAARLYTGRRPAWTSCTLIAYWLFSQTNTSGSLWMPAKFIAPCQSPSDVPPSPNQVPTTASDALQLLGVGDPGGVENTAWRSETSP